jgi:hypothetical protein
MHRPLNVEFTYLDLQYAWHQNNKHLFEQTNMTPTGAQDGAEIT